jgi:hypothetical protein
LEWRIQNAQKTGNVRIGLLCEVNEDSVSLENTENAPFTVTRRNSKQNNSVISDSLMGMVKANKIFQSLSVVEELEYMLEMNLGYWGIMTETTQLRSQ